MTARCTYDANGNLTSDGTKTYFWNALNQLVDVKEGTTTIATCEYDGAARHTEKVAAGLTHQYIYDAEDIVEERISGSSSDTIRYHHGVGIDECSSQDLVETLHPAFRGGAMPKSKHQIPGRVRSDYEFIRHIEISTVCR